MNPENRGYYLRDRVLVQPQEKGTVQTRKQQQSVQTTEEPPTVEEQPLVIPLQSSLQTAEVPVVQSTNGMEKQDTGFYLEKFAGDDQLTVETWLQWFDRYSSWHKHDEGKKLLSLPFHLTSHARIWFDSLPDETKTDYNALRAAFMDRFKRHEEIDNELLEIKQRPDEVVNDYFSRVLKKAQNSGANQKLMISLAIKGLKPAIKQMVMPQNPQTFEAARKTASLAERTLLATTIPVAAFSADDGTYKMDELQRQIRDLQAENNFLKQERHLHEQREGRQRQEYPQQQPTHSNQGRHRKPWRKHEEWQPAPAWQQSQGNFWTNQPPDWNHPRKHQWQPSQRPTQRQQKQNEPDSQRPQQQCPGCRGEDLNCNYPSFCRSQKATCSLCRQKGHFRVACVPQHSR